MHKGERDTIREVVLATQVGDAEVKTEGIDIVIDSGRMIVQQ